MIRPTVTRLAGRTLTYAQASQPVLTAKIVRRLLSSGSAKKKDEPLTGTRISGLEAANRAARVPVDRALPARRSGMEAAARAAGIPD